jgi:transmembrane sensor
MENESKHIEPIDLLIRFFANEATDEERLQLEQWRDVSDNNLKEFNSFAALWNLSGKAKNKVDIDINAEWKHLDKTISTTKIRTISIARVLQIAAIVIVVFGLAFLLLKQNQSISSVTQVAQVQIINLPDGSVVTLNAKSKLTYTKDFGVKSRTVSLKGEAFFSVAKNKEMPFIIEAQGASIKVVGTQFNVKAYKGASEVKVTVIEGIVQLYESKQPEKLTLLNAGETGVYLINEHVIEKTAQINTNDISWKTNAMQFDNTPLHEVVDVLINVYHVDIVVSDVVKDCAVTVDFDRKDLASVLNVLKSTLDLKVTYKDDAIYLDGDGCENFQHENSR